MTLPATRVSDMQDTWSTGYGAVTDKTGLVCGGASRKGDTVRFVLVLLVLLSNPVEAASVALSGDPYTGLAPDIMAVGDAGQIRPPSVELQQTAGRLPPADTAGALAAGVVPAMPITEPLTEPSGRAEDSPQNRMMLFFLLLMAAVFGLLIEITTSRQRR
jgi:hypothetical protein